MPMYCCYPGEQVGDVSVFTFSLSVTFTSINNSHIWRHSVVASCPMSRFFLIEVLGTRRAASRLTPILETSKWDLALLYNTLKLLRLPKSGCRLITNDGGIHRPQQEPRNELVRSDTSNSPVFSMLFRPHPASCIL